MTSSISASKGSRFACLFSTASDEVPTAPSTRLNADELAEFVKQIPIEKRSLTRGMSVNKFEKDFIIYPEYENSVEQQRIKKIVQNLEGDLTIAYDQLKTDTATTTAQKPGTLPAKVQAILAKHKVSAAAVPAEFGGLNFCQKDLVQLSECLGNRDLNLLSTFGTMSLAVSLIVQFGTTAQKEHYLPGIASGKWRPAVCIQDETSGPQPIEHVFSAKGQQQFLSVIKKNVENALDANLFIVFGNRRIGELIIPACYLIERDWVKEDEVISSIKIRDQLKTGGLQHCNFSTVVFENVPLRDYMLLGSTDNAGYSADELSIEGKIAYGAGVVGHLKKMIGKFFLKKENNNNI
uniref:Acyl-CoA_dh_N domain-containing protein n=1 Tax=Globodera pallida TaxID=36090 RepID=A0A183CBU6_GLOPA